MHMFFYFMTREAKTLATEHGIFPYYTRARLVVWSIFGMMLLAALAFVWRYGSNVPSWDDWDMVPIMTRHQRVTFEWLWSQHNEHRIPVPRIIALVLYSLFGLDFRVGMYFNVVTAAGLAFAMILLTKRLRGHLEYSDAFFPLLLLNWGQGLNFIWSWQMEFFLSTNLAGMVLLIIMHSGVRPTLRTAMLIGICLLLLTMCGAHGVALVPALALWVAYFGIHCWRSGTRWAKRDGAFIVGIAVLALLFVGLYFVGFEKVPHHPSSSSPWVSLKTTVKFLTMGFGPAVRSVWPFSGLAALLLLAFSVALLIIGFWKVPGERTRTLGIILFICALASLGLGIGLGRDGFEPRYITLSVPVWCCIYFIGVTYTPLKVGRALQVILAVLTCAALWPNMTFGLDYAKDLRTGLAAFERKMTVGTPSHQLISGYSSYLHPHHDTPNEYMPMLRQAGVGSFRFLKKDPPFREFTLPLVPARLNEVKWVDRIAYATGTAPYLVFNLPVERYLSGVRLKYTYTSPTGTCPYVGLFWKRHAQNKFTSLQFYKYSPTGDKATWCRGTWERLNDREATMTVWICDTVGQLRINPDFKPGIFTIYEISLLYPAAE